MSYEAVVVEDHATSADIIARQLEAIGFTNVQKAGSGAEGIQWVEHIKPSLVVIDERLPDASGTDLVRMVRAQYPDITIAMCTVVDDESVMQAAFAAGCNYYTVKPNGLRRLCIQRSSAENMLDVHAQEVFK